MHGIVSLLPQPYYKKVESLWDELESQFGLKGIRVTPFPHFSWQIGEEYDLPALKLVLSTVAKQTKPFPVTATGVGIFSGPNPVIFIPVIKSPQLVRFHQQVWKALMNTGQGFSDYYSPQNWVPHISLAYMDVNQQNISGVTQHLAFQSLYWEFEVNNFTYIYEPDGMVGKINFQTGFSG